VYSGFVGAAMINTITTIFPIFAIILLGWLARVFGEFAVVAISVNTLLSAVTYTIWLSLVGQ